MYQQGLDTAWDILSSEPSQEVKVATASPSAIVLTVEDEGPVWSFTSQIQMRTQAPVFIS